MKAPPLPTSGSMLSRGVTGISVIPRSFITMCSSWRSTMDHRSMEISLRGLGRRAIAYRIHTCFSYRQIWARARIT